MLIRNACYLFECKRAFMKMVSLFDWSRSLMGDHKTLTVLSLTLILQAFSLTFSPLGHSGSLPPYPLMETRVTPSSSEQEKARGLFRLAHRENRRLEWDECLSRKAFRRAKAMVEEGAFAHKDPKTGKNPAWPMVSQCDRFRYAGENLAQGQEPAEVIHRALMESPTHRANVISSKYRFLGVGCYDQVCVELFAGF
jgi:hypothetical protein